MYATQYPAPIELRVLLQPPGQASVDHYPNYVTPISEDARDETFIPRLELGIEKHRYFHGRTVEWVYIDYCLAPFIDRKYQRESLAIAQAYPEFCGHSTCTASKAVGITYGAAKEVSLVVVKMSDHSKASYRRIMKTA